MKIKLFGADAKRFEKDGVPCWTILQDTTATAERLGTQIPKIHEFPNREKTIQLAKNLVEDSAAASIPAGDVEDLYLNSSSPHHIPCQRQGNGNHGRLQVYRIVPRNRLSPINC